MKPKLFLHIGHSKVASSSIQAFQDANIDYMRSQGFLVADMEGTFPTEGPVFSCPVGVLQTARDAGPEGFELLHVRLRDLHETLTRRRSKFDRAVISAENLCNPRFELMFEPMRELFDMHLIYYIRRQDEWLISAWKQWGIKSGKNLKEYCMQGTQSRYPAYTASIDRWAPLVQTMHVRPLHASTLHDGSITADYAHALGLDGAKMQHTGISNPSFDAAVLDVLSRNPYLFEHPDDDRIFHFLTEFLPKEIKPMRAILDWEVRTGICRFFEEENRALHQRFFPDADYDKLFSPHEFNGGQQPTPPQQLLYRFLGLQLRALMNMHQELKDLRAKVP
ncbi:MAG: hypothetical protein AB7O97_17855 [Planctomycetota bacterium]